MMAGLNVLLVLGIFCAAFLIVYLPQFIWQGLKAIVRAVDSWSQNKIDVAVAQARDLPIALVNPELYDQDPVLLGGEQ